MLDIFKSLKGFLKPNPVNVDHNVFRLHYKVTVFMLLAFFLFVTSNQYIGDPIDCIIDDIPSDVMDTYCWIYGTFTMPNKINGIRGRDLIQPGVASGYIGKDEIKYHKYYQWVYFVLFFQAALFYIPRYLWKMWEGNRVKMLTYDLNTHIIDANHLKQKKKIIIKSLRESLGHNNFYFCWFVLCETLCFINVVSQMLFMNYFLDGEFFTYGTDVLKMTELEPEMRHDPMSVVFPKITKCTFHKYGPSGTIQNLDGLCVLPLNIINEKIYLILWFWFVLLSILSCLSLIYRTVVLLIPKVRVYMLFARTTHSSHIDVESILDRCQIGDWFFLYQVSKNIDEMVFKEILTELNVEISTSIV